MRMFVGESHSYFSQNRALWSERLNGIIFQIFDMYSTVSLYVFASVANVQRLCKWLWDISEKSQSNNIHITLKRHFHDTELSHTKTLGLLIYTIYIYIVLLISWWGIKCSVYLLLSLTWTPLNLHMARELKNRFISVLQRHIYVAKCKGKWTKSDRYLLRENAWGDQV